MHTIIATFIGLVLLGASVGIAPTKSVGARRFLPIWLVLCTVHLIYGVAVAGYGLAMELGVHAVVFGVPAAIAFTLTRRARTPT